MRIYPWIKDKDINCLSCALAWNGKPLEALTAPVGASPFRNAVYYMMPEDIVRSGFSIEGSVSIQAG